MKCYEYIRFLFRPNFKNSDLLFCDNRSSLMDEIANFHHFLLSVCQSLQVTLFKVRASELQFLKSHLNRKG